MARTVIMIPYINLNTKVYPIYEMDIRRLYNLDTENFIIPDNYAVVQVVTQPQYNPYTQTIQEANPTLINGQWTQVWEVIEISIDILTQRNELYKKSVIDAIQIHLDAEAIAHYYDGILSACSYATSTNPKFGPEGRAAVIWRDSVWSTAYQILGEVQGGLRSLPTIEQVMSELPTMEWPI